MAFTVVYDACVLFPAPLRDLLMRVGHAGLAVRSGAQVIVTANLKDFPSQTLKTFGIEPQSADEFVLNLIDLAPGAVAAIVSQQAADLKNPPQTREQLLETLLTNGLVRSVARLRELFT